jgi:hypothetical protein
MVFIAALVAVAIYAIARGFISDKAEPFFLVIYIAAWIIGFLRWLCAVVFDPRKPLE